MIINLKHISSDQNRHAMLSNKDSVAIVISYSGEEQEIKRIVNYIKQKEGTVIAVTSINEDYCLTICSKENIFSKIGSYSSKVSADYIMDIIFSLLFKNNNNINLIEKLERAKNIQNIEFLKN
jgi:DNA-binding MurR/RpiR family transcriptional regulator